MDRLTGRYYDVTNDIWHWSIKSNSTNDGLVATPQEILDKLARYEDLEEQGRLVELPCKRGEKAYYITQNLEGETIIASGIFHLAWLDYYEYIFATKEEAEAKLEGGNNEDNL